MNIPNLQLYLVFVVTLLISCQASNQSKDELQKQYDEIIRIHDEVMPKTAELHRLIKQLKNDNNAGSGSELNTRVEQIIHSLESADEGMMSWMHDFKKPDHKDIEASKNYYQQEMDKINKVQSDIIQSIEDAEKLIQQ